MSLSESLAALAEARAEMGEDEVDFASQYSDPLESDDDPVDNPALDAFLAGDDAVAEDIRESDDEFEPASEGDDEEDEEDAEAEETWGVHVVHVVD